MGSLDLEPHREFFRSVREAGPPCRKCAYETLAGYCSHPLNCMRTFDPATGRFVEIAPLTIQEARAPDAQCAPKGVLFEQCGEVRHWVNRIYGAGNRHPWMSVVFYFALILGVGHLFAG